MLPALTIRPNFVLISCYRSGEVQIQPADLAIILHTLAGCVEFAGKARFLLFFEDCVAYWANFA